LLQEGRFEEALAPLSEAIQLKPDFARALNGRGFAYMQLRRWEEAIADFTAAIAIDPNYSNAYRNRAAARRMAGDAEGAKADAAMAAKTAGP
jgi:Flp pilus assembly protein TadD